MSLVRWNNRSFFPNVSSLFDGFFNDDVEVLNTNNKALSVPAVNVVENDDDYTLELAAPGKTKEDFDIKIDKGMLSISSEQEEENESENKNYTRKEYSYSSFNRSFNLPEEVNDDDVKASYQDGILSIVLPKTHPVVTSPKSVAIS